MACELHFGAYLIPSRRKLRNLFLYMLLSHC